MNLRRVFVGPTGLRPGWCVALFLLIVAALSGLAFVIIKLTFGKPHLPHGELPLTVLAARELIGCLIILAATAAMARIERRPWSAYGFAGAHAARNAAAGLAGGLACLCVLVGVLHAGGYLSLSVAQHAAGPALAYGAAWLVVFSLVGVSEEALFRGYLLATLARPIGFWPAALVMGLLFGAGHAANPGETAIGLGGVVVAAITLTVLLRFTGSLWASIGFHTGWDWAQSSLFGVADSGLMMQGHLLAAKSSGPAWISGGATGPEGSILALPAFALGGVMVLLMLRRRAGQRLGPITA